MIITDEMLYRNAEKACKLYLNELTDGYNKEPAHEFSKKFLKNMRRIIRDQRRTPQMRVAIKSIRKAAIVILIIFAGLFATTMSVEAYREQFINLIKKITGKSNYYS